MMFAGFKQKVFAGLRVQLVNLKNVLKMGNLFNSQSLLETNIFIKKL